MLKIGIYQEIINKLKKGESISELTNPIKEGLKDAQYDLPEILKKYIAFLKEISPNSRVWPIIDSYAEGNKSLIDMSKCIFKDIVKIDEEKRKGVSRMFFHFPDDTFLDEIFRVLYHFTRDDVSFPKGVCYDFCLFIAGIFMSRPNESRIFLWHSVEASTSENNYVIIMVDDNTLVVYDPFNKRYVPGDQYDKARVGFTFTELGLEHILQPSIYFTVISPEITHLDKIISSFFDKSQIVNTLKNKNYYERLGISPDAGDDEIKNAYRIVSKIYHPDSRHLLLFKVEMFKLLGEAYDTLKNPDQRRIYDIHMGFCSKPLNSPEDNQRDTSVNSDDVTHEQDHNIPITKISISLYVGLLIKAYRLNLDLQDELINIIYKITKKHNIKSLDELDNLIGYALFLYRYKRRSLNDDRYKKNVESPDVMYRYMNNHLIFNK